MQGTPGGPGATPESGGKSTQSLSTTISLLSTLCRGSPTITHNILRWDRMGKGYDRIHAVPLQSQSQSFNRYLFNFLLAKTLFLNHLKKHTNNDKVT